MNEQQAREMLILLRRMAPGPYEHRMIIFDSSDLTNPGDRQELWFPGVPIPLLDKLSGEGWEVVGVTFRHYDLTDDPDSERYVEGVALIRRPVQQS